MPKASAPKEGDGYGSHNNILHSHDLTPLAGASTISSAAPSSTTSQLAGQVAKEVKPSSDLPGSFPETPANEAQQFSVNPLPATSGSGNPVHLAPGAKVPDSSTLTDNTVSSTAKDDPSLKASANESENAFGVAPLPATGGIGNPIHLQPGEKVPHPSDITSNTVTSNVTLDKESYERGPSGAPQLGPVVTPEKERDATGGMFGIPPISGTMIPESSLPMGAGASAIGEKDTGPHIQSAAPQSTTAQLAGQVPLEPKEVPETVTDSQKAAGVSPEASANPEAVQEKKQVENELNKVVPEAPATSGDQTNLGKAAAVAGGTAVAGAAAFAGATYAAKDKAAEYISPSIQKSIDEMNAGARGVAPSAVTESQQQAHQSPEASANPEAVREKSAVERELLSAVPTSDASGAPAHGGVPEVVTESMHKAHANPEATANPEALAEKEKMENELQKKIKPSQDAGEVAPTTSAALSSTAPGAPKETSTATDGGLNAPASHPAQVSATQPSRDVSPMTKSPGTENQTQPMVTTGPTTTTTAPKSDAKTAGGPVADAPKGAEKPSAGPATPKKDPATAKASVASGTPSSAKSEATTDSKKDKRRSFFGKIKDKLSSK